MVLMVLFTSLQIVEVNDQRKQQLITVYNVRKQTAIALVNGTEVSFLSSKALYENEPAMLFHIKHHWWKLGIDKINFIELNDSVFNKEIKWNDKKFAVMNIPKTGWDEELETNAADLDFVVVNELDRKSHASLEELSIKVCVLSSSLKDKSIDAITSLLLDESEVIVYETRVGAIEL
jgi:hypothetical protein